MHSVLSAVVLCVASFLFFFCFVFFFLRIRRPPRSTQSRSSAASDVYKRQLNWLCYQSFEGDKSGYTWWAKRLGYWGTDHKGYGYHKTKSDHFFHNEKSGHHGLWAGDNKNHSSGWNLSLIHISEPTRLLSISYAVFCLKKKTTRQTITNVQQRRRERRTESASKQ